MNVDVVTGIIDSMKMELINNIFCHEKIKNCKDIKSTGRGLTTESAHSQQKSP